LNPKTYFKGRENRISKRKLKQKAKALYEKMYYNFAKGNKEILDEFCGEGLMSSINQRIAKRPNDKVLQWEVTWLKQPTQVFRSSAELGLKISGKNITYQQAIFLMKSEQKIRIGTVPRGKKWGESSKESEATWEGAESEKPKVVEEYMVLQRRFLDKVAEDWYLWGFLKQESIMTFEKFVEIQQKKKAEKVIWSYADQVEEHSSHSFVRSLKTGVTEKVGILSRLFSLSPKK
jgi:hypothetical protein